MLVMAKNPFTLYLKQTHYRYLLVGAVTTLIYLLAFYCLYYPLGLAKNTAISISFSFYLLISFISHKHISFGNKAYINFYQQIGKYIGLCVINYVVTIWIMSEIKTHSYIWVYSGLIISLLSTTVLGFIAAKYWIFRN